MDREEEKLHIHHIIWYIVIFSVIGLIIETIFCYITTGVIESRKGLVWGPVCPVYGVGAVFLIIILKKYQNNPIKLFVWGSIIGNVIEYLLSYILEAMYGTRFWDYAFVSLNLNGRICIKYSLFWGILAIILLKYIEPFMRKIVDKIPENKRKMINSIVVTYLVIDCIATVWGITTYQNRVENMFFTQIEETKTPIMQIKKKIEDTLFSNEFMKKTFPNLRYIDNEGNEYYIKKLLEATN